MVGQCCVYDRLMRWQDEINKSESYASRDGKMLLKRNVPRKETVNERKKGTEQGCDNGSVVVEKVGSKYQNQQQHVEDA